MENIEIINKFISFIKEKGLKEPAIIFFESIKPISFILGQVILFFSPILVFFSTTEKLFTLVDFLSDKKNIDLLIKELENNSK
jgi:hypothetical protein